MQSWLKSLLGSGELKELPAELTELLAQAKRDKKALRDLLKRAETASKKVESLVDPVETMGATAESLNLQLSEFQIRVDAFEKTASTIDAVALHATGLAEWQAAHATSSEEADRTVSDLSTKVNELRTVVAGAMTAKKEVAELVGPKGLFSQILKEVDTVHTGLKNAETRANTLEKSVSRLELLEQRAKKIEASQEHLTETVERGSSAADQLEERIGKVHAQLEAVSSTEKLIKGFLDPEGGVGKLRANLDEMMVDYSRLEVRSNAFGAIEERILAIGEQADGLKQDQEAMARTVESASKSVDETHAKLSELGDGIQTFQLVKREVEDLTGPKGALTKVRAQIEEAREKSLNYGQEVARIREDQADARAAQEGVLSRYEEVRSKMESVEEGVDKANVSVARVEKAVTDLAKAEELGARTERQLTALQTLSDHINQKLASVERQREALDRTEAQARAL